MESDIQQEDRATVRSPKDNQSTASTLREVFDDVSGIIQREIALAKTEIGENLDSVKNGISSVAVGTVIMLAGIIILLFSAVYGLANFIDLWLAALIVGGTVSVIGYSMFAAGKSKVSADTLKPDHTIQSIKRDAHVARGV